MSPLLATPLTWRSLTWPRVVEAGDLLAALRQVAGTRQVPLVLRTEGRPGVVDHLVGSTSERMVQLLGQGVVGLSSEVTAPKELTGPATALRLRFSTRRRAVSTDDAERSTASVLSALANVRDNECLVLEWALLSVLAAQAVPNRLEGLGPDRWSAALASAFWQGSGRVDPEVRRALAAKRAEAGWRAVGRLAVVAATEGRRRMLLSGVLAALRAADSPGLHLVARRTRPSALGRVGALTTSPAAISLLELPILAGWPVGDLRTSPARHNRSRLLLTHRAMPPVDEDSGQRLVAVGQRGSQRRALVLSVNDGLRHTHVLGPTGSGKSTMLLGLIEADMATGRSLVLFDPKGDLVSDVLARIPVERRRHVVVLDPSDDCPVGLNPLAGGDDPELVADGLLGTFHELFAAHWGPRTQDVLHACLLTLAQTPGSSLALVPLLLTNPGYRRRVTAGISDPLGLGGFWQWYEGLSEAERLAVIGPVMNKLRQILLRPALRGVIGQQQPRFDLRELFTSRRIVLVRLAKGSLGPEGAALFGALVWSRLWELAQQRSRIEPKRRHPVTVFADEFQEYLKAPVSFTDMLVQARGLGVGLVLAHQHLGQLSTEVRQAVLGNAGSRVVFQLLAGDAAAIAKLGQDLEAEDIAGLGSYEVYASLRSHGTDTGWMSGHTQPPGPTLGDPAQVQAESRRQFGRQRAETEAALRAAIDGGSVDHRAGPLGVKRRAGGRG